MSEDKRENEDLPVDSNEQNRVKQNIKSSSIWLRLFFMLVVAFLFGVSRVVVAAVVVIQFFWVLFTADINEELKQLGQQLAYYTYQIIRYLTFNTDERPFPFELEWPKDQRL